MDIDTGLFVMVYCVYTVYTVGGISVIFLDPVSGEAFYKQIIDQIRIAIVTGRIASHTLLPSVRELATQIGVSVITVKRAYTDLENSGYLYTRPGIGTYVCEIDTDRAIEDQVTEIQRRFCGIIRSAKQSGIGDTQIRTAFIKALEAEGE